MSHTQKTMLPKLKHKYMYGRYVNIASVVNLRKTRLKFDKKQPSLDKNSLRPIWLNMCNTSNATKLDNVYTVKKMSPFVSLFVCPLAGGSRRSGHSIRK